MSTTNDSNGRTELTALSQAVLETIAAEAGTTVGEVTDQFNRTAQIGRNKPQFMELSVTHETE